MRKSNIIFIGIFYFNVIVFCHFTSTINKIFLNNVKKHKKLISTLLASGIVTGSAIVNEKFALLKNRMTEESGVNDHSSILGKVLLKDFSTVDIKDNKIEVTKNSYNLPSGDIKKIVEVLKNIIMQDNSEFIQEQDDIKKAAGLDFFDFLTLCLQEQYICCDNDGKFFNDDAIAIKIGNFIYQYGEYLKQHSIKKDVINANFNHEEVYVVTDSQGNAAGLAYAIIMALSKKKKILFLGDYEGLRKTKNRGSRAASLLATLMIGVAKRHPDILCVKGNHEINFNEGYQDLNAVLRGIDRISKGKFQCDTLLSLIYDVINNELALSIVNTNSDQKKQIFKHCACPVCNFKQNFQQKDANVIIDRVKLQVKNILESLSNHDKKNNKKLIKILEKMVNDEQKIFFEAIKQFIQCGMDNDTWNANLWMDFRLALKEEDVLVPHFQRDGIYNMSLQGFILLLLADNPDVKRLAQLKNINMFFGHTHGISNEKNLIENSLNHQFCQLSYDDLDNKEEELINNKKLVHLGTEKSHFRLHDKNNIANITLLPPSYDEDFLIFLLNTRTSELMTLPILFKNRIYRM